MTRLCALVLAAVWCVRAAAAPASAATLDLTAEERAWIAANPVIRVHNETDWPPFNFAVKGVPQGYSIDFMNLVAERTGLTVQYVTGPTWSQFLDMMKAGSLDVMLNIVRTPDRQQYLLYTPPIADNPNTILSRKGDAYASLADLAGKTVSVPKGFFYEEVLKREHPGIRLKLVENTLETMKAVSFGQADAAVGELAVFNHLMDEHLLSGLVMSGEVRMGDPELSLLNIATRKDLPVLASILSKAVVSVSAEERRDIRNRWLPSPFVGIDAALVLKVGGAGGLMLVVVMLWNRRLQREVRERKRAEIALRRSESRLSDAIDSLSAGFALFDGDKRLVLCNTQYMRTYGYAEADVPLGVSLSDLTELDARRGVVAKGDGVETLRRRATVYGDTTETFLVPLTSGRWIQVRDRPTTDGGVVSIHTDITERIDAENAIKRARDAAEQATEAKSEFVAVVSHEIRTPMNGVLGMARHLDSMALDDDQRACVETIIASGAALIDIINDLLDVSKLEAGKLELEAIPFVLDEMITQAMAVMAPRAEEKGLSFVPEIDADLPAVVIGDPHRLRQVLLNLISNAIKFTESGGITVRATLETSSGQDAVVEFAVSDTGIGISKAYQQRLFDDYAQASVEVARKYGGTGLGLSICRRLVELMGSDISLESAPGAGSTFSFAVPLVVGAVADLPDETLHSAARIASERPLSVLQVEDNATNAQVVERALRAAGHQVQTVVNGQEALGTLPDGDFDAILMDRHMPVLDGCAATRAIRAMDGAKAALPIIGVTAGVTPVELRECREAGMTVVLPKPIDIDWLLSELHRLTALPVLLVDDDTVNHAVMARHLERLGIAHRSAYDGTTALSLIGEGRYRALFVDLSMPDMDGLAVTRAVREAAVPMPVFLVTGHTGDEVRRDAADAGADGVLTKPVTFETLRDCFGGAAESAPTPRPAAAETAQPIDLDGLSEVVGSHDEEVLLSMLDVFTDAFPELLPPMSDAVAAEDGARLRDAAHKAKSAALNAAARPLATLLSAIEQDAAAGDWPELAARVTEAQAAYVDIEAFVAERRDGGGA